MISFVDLQRDASPLPKEKSGRNCKKSARILGPGDHVTRELVQRGQTNRDGIPAP